MGRITRLRLENWKNFGEVDVALQQRVFVVGPNGSGKSNLLDALRFLADIASDEGGLQRAVRSRGGFTALRARSGAPSADVTIGVDVAVSDEDTWRYELVLGERSDGPVVILERVWHADRLVLDRASEPAGEDVASARQTHLEQAVANAGFRPMVEVLRGVQYVHVVPQLFRDPQRPRLEGDEPHDRALLERVAAAPAERRAELVAIAERALKAVVPQLRSLTLAVDERGRPRLVPDFAHWRSGIPAADERTFSDGMLRLLGLVWALLDGGGPLLLEEPEQSLHSAVLPALPGLIYSTAMQRGRQVVLTTHARELFLDEGIGLDEVLMLTAGDNGTSVATILDRRDLLAQFEAGIPLHDIIPAATGVATSHAIASLALAG